MAQWDENRLGYMIRADIIAPETIHYLEFLFSLYSCANPTVYSF